jgi:hypothetical protein
MRGRFRDFFEASELMLPDLLLVQDTVNST